MILSKRKTYHEEDGMVAASITETPNELTTDIDLASIGIVRLLRQTDSQIYNGYLGFPGFNDREVLEAIAMTIKQTRQIFASKGKKVLIISGAGTSGRLGMFVARAYNRTVKRHYEKQLHQVFNCRWKPCIACCPGNIRR